MSYRFILGNARRIPLPDQSVHCCVTSPPYFGLRDYDVAGQAGLEDTPAEYVAGMVEKFREVHRVLRDDGTLWMVVGDSYQSGKGMSGGSKKYANGTHVVDQKQPARRFGLRPNDVPIEGLKSKDLIGVPWMLAFALRDDGWYLRSDIIWFKRNPMPESVVDRPTKAHEYIFLLTKSAKYYYDSEAIKVASASSTSSRLAQDVASQKGSTRANAGAKTNGNMKAVGDPESANKRSVWDVPTKSTKDAHFATYPPKLIAPCVLAGTSEAGVCPKCGAPWRRVVTKKRVATRPGLANKAEGLDKETVGNRDHGRHVTKTTTVGWESSCTCLEARWPRPAVVLDPFGGAMTTSLVCESLGRDSVAVELNPKYIAIGQRRLREAARTAYIETRQRKRRPRRRPVAGQMSLLFPEVP